MRPEDLLRAHDIAALCHVSDAAVSQWRRRHSSFPGPWLERGAGRTAVRLWLASDVAEWLARTGRAAWPLVDVAPARAERAERLAAAHESETSAYLARRRRHGRPYPRDGR